MALPLHALHQAAGASFGLVHDREAALHYGDPAAELRRLRDSAGLIDLSLRGRLCLLGPDRQRFLHGQVTNDIRRLTPGQGCYACLLNAKGKLESDLLVHCLKDELLLDVEPGMTPHVQQRLEAYIIAEDVQVVDVAPHYGLLALLGPSAPRVLPALISASDIPGESWTFHAGTHDALGELYVMRQPIAGQDGFQLYFPAAAMTEAARLLSASAQAQGGGWVGWDALEMLRIESGVPRFGVDMDAANLPPEAGLESRAISYSKGCYIGQEIIARLRTYGQVAKALRGFRLDASPLPLPAHGDKVRCDGKEVGRITSALHSPTLDADIALGYVRREHNRDGQRLTVVTAAGERAAEVVPLPFVA